MKTFCELFWSNFHPNVACSQVFPFVHCFMRTYDQMVINGNFSNFRTSSSTWQYPGYVLPCENLEKYAMNPSCKFINLPLWWIRRSLAVSLFCLRLFTSAAPSSMQQINLSVDGWTTAVLICLLSKNFADCTCRTAVYTRARWEIQFQICPKTQQI